MSKDNVDDIIKYRDKPSLYRLHMKGEISDEALFDAIIEIDNSVKSKKTDCVKLVHNILFPSTVEH